jgi:hypothetical protein
MRLVRSLSVMAAAILAFGVLAPTVAAQAPKAFHLDKTCVSDVFCTVVASDFKPIPAGTDITYVNSDPWIGIAYPTIVVGNSSTTGVCDWNQPPGPVLAKCTFGTGSGRLTQFNMAVDVTVTGDPASPLSVWHWDGTYWMGG